MKKVSVAKMVNSVFKYQNSKNLQYVYKSFYEIFCGLQAHKDVKNHHSNSSTPWSEKKIDKVTKESGRCLKRASIHLILCPIKKKHINK